MEKASGRMLAVDNLRAVMIFFVVAGHLLEFIAVENGSLWYDVIYTFHMPVFAFLSGICCKSSNISGKQLWSNVVWPYMVFQMLYLLVSNHIWNVELSYQFTQPYWILWYMMAIFHWRIMLMMAQTAKYRWIAMVISVAAALLVGLDVSMGYFMTFSRAFVLFPFFYAGFCARRYQSAFSKFMHSNLIRAWVIRIAAAVLGAGLIVFATKRADEITSAILWHSYAYSDEVGHMGDRALVLLLGFLWLAVFAVLTPGRKIPLLTYIGQNTMPVFLLHGFLMRGLSYNWEMWHEMNHVALVVGLTILTPVVFSMKPVVMLTRPLMMWPFGEKKNSDKT